MIIFTILIVALVGFAIYNLICLLGARQEEIGFRKRMNRLSKKQEIDDVRNELLKEKKEKNQSGIGWKIASEKLDGELEAAGIKISGEEYLRFWLMAVLLPAFLVLVMGGSGVTALALAILGLVIPPMLVSSAKKKKDALFDKQLGDALLIMSNSLRAGYTFQQSMESIAKDMQPPISDEFRIVIREMDMGASMENALQHMVDRTKNDDVKILVSAVLISSQVGANLADVLDSISGTIRGRLEMKEQIQVLTAQGRLSGLIVGALPIVLFITLMIMNPEYILSFLSTPIGISFLMIGMVMEVLGFIVINRMIDLKY